MYCDENDPEEVFWKNRRRGMPRCGQQMVRFINNQPMRPFVMSAQLLNARYQPVKVAGPVSERDSQQVDDRIFIVLEQREHLFRSGCVIRTANVDRVLESLIVPLGIDHPKLIFALTQP